LQREKKLAERFFNRDYDVHQNNAQLYHLKMMRQFPRFDAHSAISIFKGKFGLDIDYQTGVGYLETFRRACAFSARSDGFTSAARAKRQAGRLRIND
jgi:hypothetical protein